MQRWFFLLFHLTWAQFAPKAFYLIDSLSLSRFSKKQQQTLRRYFYQYHQANHDTQKVRILNELCTTMVKENYPYTEKYLHYAQTFLSTALRRHHQKPILSYLYQQQIHLWNTTGFYYLLNKNYATSEEYYQKSLKLAQQQRFSKEVAQTLMHLGDLYLQKKVFQQSRQYYQQAFEHYQRIKDLTGMLQALMGIARTYRAEGNYQAALNYYRKGLRFVNEKVLPEQQAALYRGMATTYYLQGEYPKAIKYYEKSIQLYRQLKDWKNAAWALMTMGNAYAIQGIFSQALECYFESLKLFEQQKDQKGLAKIYNNIGILYYQQKDYDKALSYYFKSLQMEQDTYGLALIYGNIGIVYSEKGENKKALKYYLKCLEIFEKLQDKRGIAMTLNNIGIVYLNLQDYKKAEIYQRRSLKAYQEIGAKSDMAYPLKSLAIVYLHQKRYQLALHYAHQAYRIAKETQNLIPLRDAAQTLSQIYEQLGDYKNAHFYYKAYIRYRDSIQNESHERELVRKELQYQYEKEKAIQEAKHKAELEKQKALAQAQRKRQNIVIASISTILIIVLVFIAILYNRLQVIRRQRDTIIQQNAILEQQKEELRVLSEDLHRKNLAITAQSQELRRLNEQLQRQNDELERKNKAITDSISYASRIQRALLRKSDELRSALPHCLVYMPCQQVSGDFYWIAKQNGCFYVAVADCTGHGVPGALISIMGMEYLSTLLEEGIYEPHLLLDQLRQHIIQTLSGSKGEYLQDGMDIALAKIDFHKKTLYWSAANSHLYCIQNNQLITLQGDKQPVGWYPKMQPFQQHTFQWQENTILCFFSDGFPDQFGGKRGKKLGYKRFQQLLLAMQKFPIQEWEHHLIEVFHRWRGEHEQIDDVTFLGIQLL